VHEVREVSYEMHFNKIEIRFLPKICSNLELDHLPTYLA
jgi:hypothetical protein